MEWCSHCLRFRQTRRVTLAGSSEEFSISCNMCGKILWDSTCPLPISFEPMKKHKGSRRKKRAEKPNRGDAIVDNSDSVTSTEESKDGGTPSKEVKRKRTIDEE